MEEHFLVSLFIPIAFFSTVFSIFFIWRKSLHRERMAMIERGMYPYNRSSNKLSLLKLSYGSVGLALGLFAGYFVHEAFEMNSVVAYSSMGCLGFGVSMIKFSKKVKILEAKKEEQDFLEDFFN